MKQLIFSLLFFVATAMMAQTFTKGDINADILSKTIQQKQEQFIKRALADLVVKDQLGIANYATYNTLYNITYALGYSNNKQEIQRVIERELTLYTITYGIANAIIDSSINEFDTLVSKDFKTTEERLKNYEIKLNEIRSNYKGKCTKIYSKKCSLNKAYKSIYSIRIGENNVKIKKYSADSSFNIIIDSVYFKIREDKALLEKYGLKFSENVISTGVKILDNRERKDIILIKKSMERFYSFYVKAKKLDSLLKHYQIDSATHLASAENFAKLLNALRDFIQPYVNEVPNNQLVVSIIGTILENTTFSRDTDGNNKPKLNYDIDVESIIVTLAEKYSNSSFISIKYNDIGLEPLALIGINQATFTSPGNASVIPGIEPGTATMTFAGEKIGLRVVFADFAYARSFKPGQFFWYRGTQRQWTKPVRTTYFKKAYAMVYTSGVAYSLFNLSSQKNFNTMLIGAGLGLSAYNDLSLNLSYATPLLYTSTDKWDGMALNKGLWCLSFDIPIVEYIQALTEK